MYIMPYRLKEFDDKWKVCDDKRCFSKNPLSKKTAKKQRIALAISTAKKEGKPLSTYFV